MYVIKVTVESESSLVYSFHEQITPVSDDIGRGIFVIRKSLSNFYKDYPLAVTMTIMDDRGLFYCQKENKYIPTVKYEDIVIPLNEIAKEKLQEFVLGKNGE